MPQKITKSTENIADEKLLGYKTVSKYEYTKYGATNSNQKMSND